MSDICPKCGRRVQEFKQTGILGCPYCYVAFKEEVTEYLTETQGRLTHEGKCPKLTKDDKILIAEYKRLIKEKQDAILAKRFKEAGALDKEIKVLNDELVRRGLKK